MNETDDNPWDDVPTGAASPLDSEATPTVILGGGAAVPDAAATEIVSRSPIQSAAAQQPVAPQPEQPPAPEYVPTTATPVVDAHAASSPFPAGGGGGSGGGPFDTAAADGGSDSMMTLLMALALVGMLLIIVLLWFKRCDSADVDRLLDIGLAPLTVQLDVITNLFGGR